MQSYHELIPITPEDSGAGRNPDLKPNHVYPASAGVIRYVPYLYTSRLCPTLTTIICNSLSETE